MSQAGALATLWLSHAVVVLLLITALFAGRDAWRSPQGRLLAALAVSLAALELATGPGSEVWAEPLRTALRLVGVANLALLWLFSLSILRDDFRMGRLEVAGTLVLVLGPMLVAFDQAGQIANPVLASFSAAVPFIMIAHIGWICFAEHAGDLVRGRRRARFWIPLILALASLTSVLAEEVADASTASLIRNALAGLPISLVILWWLLAIDPSRLRFTGPASMRIEPQVDSRDAALLVQLLALMEQEELYLEADVRIDQLAQRLGSPVHRLRALINAGLGHRNFADFINRYRLANAKAALADTMRGRETILAIAFESGFTSLQTFNRVFRQSEGVTPTAYRTRALAATAHDPKIPLA